jgi:hypothetical protein
MYHQKTGSQVSTIVNSMLQIGSIPLASVWDSLVVLFFLPFNSYSLPNLSFSYPVPPQKDRDSTRLVRAGKGDWRRARGPPGGLLPQ